ncbi:probable cation-transporting ATPase 13A5 [Trichechus manatus latirostris]|uniref:Cation-transporting ATPase n=1 Tax=Trichechus manatus latirostris TaxID=127582 RepID=A0A2Y9FZ20_TRIMA|nr:probable cation-transporting ATPase 13A5 [Trichechus manatus latirostris]
MEVDCKKGQRAVLNPGEENELEAFGYRSHTVRSALCFIASVLTCGVLLLVFYWRPQWRVWATCVPCPLQEADTVLLRTMLRCIQVQKIRYVWDNLEKQFQKVGLLEDSNSCYDIHHTYGLGLTSEEQEVRRLVCGPNAIEVEIQPIWKLLVKQVLNPFYVFQAFTLILWLSQGYLEYSVAIIILSVISIVLSVYDLRQQSVNLHNLVEEHNKVRVTINIKDKELEEEESKMIIVLGESIPVTKTPLPQSENTMPWKSHSLEDYRRHVLFCGTEVIQVKPSGQGPVRAVVLQIGYNTAKGDLVRSILYPQPLNFKLYSDAFKFIVFLACLGILGFFYALGVYMYHGVPARDTMTMALLLLTVTVPPVLPAALTAGIVYAQKRLQRKGIFCMSPQRINMCGQINLVCFDKTGTLTEDGLDLWGTVPTADNCFQEVHSFASGKALPWGPLCAAMASCHSLILLDGTVQGDPLDLKMFEGTAWKMEDCSVQYCVVGTSDSNVILKPGPRASESPVEAITVLRQFPFSSGLQRMSVVAQLAGGDRFHVYMKGAPETVARFCRLETVPKNFSQELRTYTMQGFRVIALAHKALKMGALSEVLSLAREILIYIQLAHLCDNLQTAITVAKNSGMVPQGSRVILVEAKEPEEFAPASVTWQLVENQANGGVRVEGRAALVSSFGVFKYLTMYGIIQFIGTSLLYWQLQLFGNYQYLMQDVAITLMVCLTMSSTQAYPKLAPYRPAGQLLSPPLLLSVILNSCFTCIVQICAFLFVKQQPWYFEVYRCSECFLANQMDFSMNVSLGRNWTGNATLTPGSILSFESTTLWPITTINCITVAFIFSKGKPFRKPIYTNYIFSFLLLSALSLTIFILFSDFQDIYRGMEFIPTITSWRVLILVAALIQFCVAFFVEDAILQNRELWLLIKKEFGFYSKSQYRNWQKKLAEDSTWPPTNRTDYSDDGKNGVYVNLGYESPQQIPKEKGELRGQTTEEPFFTRL